MGRRTLPRGLLPLPSGDRMQTPALRQTPGPTFHIANNQKFLIQEFMRQQYLCLLLAIVALAPRIASADTIRIGSNYETVIQTLGTPDGELRAGSKRILTYGDARVILKEQKVTSVSPELKRLLSDRASLKDSVEAKREAGLVNYRGKWMPPEQQLELVQAENRKRLADKAYSSGSGLWLTDFAKASALAKSQKKKMLLSFTESDWCGRCIKLDKEVFSQTEFMNYARENYVLVKLDFPKRKPQSQAIKKQNVTLAQKYHVRAFPTVIVLSAEGKFHKSGSYVPGGPKAFLASLR